MRQKTVTVYKFSELSPEAKEKARYDYESDWGGASWERADEYLASLKALAEHLGGRVKDYEIDWTGPWSVSFDMPERPPEEEEEGRVEYDKETARLLSAAVLGTYDAKTLRGNGECKLTGMCYDENAIDGARRAFLRDGECERETIMQAAADSWKEAASKDYEYDFSDEGLSENFDANGYEFNEDGTRA